MEIKNGKLRIRNAKLRDAKILSRWWNDGEVMAHACFPDGLGISEEKVVALLSQDDDMNRRSILEFENAPVGEMNYRTTGERTAEIGIKICDPTFQDKGYGTEYLKMLLGHIFMTLGYDRIILDTNLKNKRAQHVYEKLGFRKVRTRKDSWKDQEGEWQSSVDFEISSAEYVSRYCD